MNKPNTDSKPKTVGWDSIDWQQVDRYVYKLQTRIYAASRRGDIKQVRKLQKTLMNSWSCKVLAVRRVTQENRGKKTAGVDGVKSLSPIARMKLVGQLKLTGKSKPTRRVWIPKPGKDEKRPLGIPTMHDRALPRLPPWKAEDAALLGQKAEGSAVLSPSTFLGLKPPPESSIWRSSFTGGSESPSERSFCPLPSAFCLRSILF